jgi:predicted component of type VI protein secretion system
MAKRPRSKPDLTDRFCDAIEALTAKRASRSYATQWVMLHSVARHLGISDEESQQAVALAVASRPVVVSRRTP